MQCILPKNNEVSVNETPTPQVTDSQNIYYVSCSVS
jgi:hypothetical protein